MLRLRISKNELIFNLCFMDKFGCLLQSGDCHALVCSILTGCLISRLKLSKYLLRINLLSKKR